MTFCKENIGFQQVYLSCLVSVSRCIGAPDVPYMQKIVNSTHVTYLCHLGHIMPDLSTEISFPCTCNISDVVATSKLNCQGKYSFYAISNFVQACMIKNNNITSNSHLHKDMTDHT